MDTQTNACPQCGTALTTAGLCPRCLMAAAAQPTQASMSRVEPVSLDQVAAAFPQLQIVEMIGQGGMGSVFKVRQPKLDRFAALKLLPQSLAMDPAFAGRFEREARLLAKLSHPNIVSVYDYGQAGNFFYLLMEFVDGVNLRQAMRASRFEPSQALGIVPKICEALQYAHDEGVLHRDIKPENILLDTKGRVKLVDFGIAKLTAEVDPAHANVPTLDPALTQAGASLGTPSYMAPEQRDHPSDVDHRADIYSLGVVFYELLTGELPTGVFIRPSDKSGADPRVDAIVQQALEKERDRRQHSAGEVRSQVQTLASAPADIAATVQQAVTTISQCAENDPRVVEAMTKLRNLDPSAALACLAGYLNSTTDVIRRSAIFILWKGGFTDITAAVPTLQQLLKHLENYTRGMAALALGPHAPSRDMLVALMTDDSDAYVRRCAAMAIGAPPPAQKHTPVTAMIAVSFSTLAGVLGTVAWFRMPNPPQSVVWGILASALVGIVLAIPARSTNLGKTALIVGGLNTAIWLIVFAIFASLDLEHTRDSNKVAQVSTTLPVTDPLLSERTAIEARLRSAIEQHLQDLANQPHDDQFKYDNLVVLVAPDLRSAIATVSNFRRVAAGWKSHGTDVYEQIASVDRNMVRLLQSQQACEFQLHDLTAQGVLQNNPLYIQTQQRRTDSEQRVAEYAKQYLAQHSDQIPYLEPKPANADIDLTFLGGGDWDVTGSGALAGMRFTVATADIMGGVVATTMPPGEISPGVVNERVLDADNPDHRGLNLATGDFAKSTQNHALVFNDDTTLRDANVDVFYPPTTSVAHNLLSLDMRMCVAFTPDPKPATELTVDSITDDQLRRTLDTMKLWRTNMEQSNTTDVNFRQRESAISGSNLYMFTTRDGLDGVLQITGYSDDLRKIKIRYKLSHPSATSGDISPDPKAALALMTTLQEQGTAFQQFMEKKDADQCIQQYDDVIKPGLNRLLKLLTGTSLEQRTRVGMARFDELRSAIGQKDWDTATKLWGQGDSDPTFPADLQKLAGQPTTQSSAIAPASEDHVGLSSQLQAAQTAVDLEQQKFKLGLATEADVVQAQGHVAELQAELAGHPRDAARARLDTATKMLDFVTKQHSVGLVPEADVTRATELVTRYQIELRAFESPTTMPATTAP